METLIDEVGIAGSSDNRQGPDMGAGLQTHRMEPRLPSRSTRGRLD
jgi:hypothetical protein